MALFAVAVFVLICLFSYFPLDPSWTVASTRTTIRNWGGPVGSYLADVLIFSVGGGAFLIPCFLFGISFSFFLGRAPVTRARMLTFLPIAVVLVAAGLGMEIRSVTFRDVPLQAGGMMGASLGRWLTGAFGLIGARLLVISGALLALMLTTGLSVKVVLHRISMVATELAAYLSKWSVIGLSRGKTRLGHLLAAWRERWSTRRVARQREEGLNKQLRSLQIPQGTSKNVILNVSEGSLGKSREILRSSQNDKSWVFKGTPSPAPMPAGAPGVLADGGPKIYDRVDLKVPKTTEQLALPKVTTQFVFPSLSFLDYEEVATAPLNEDELKANAKLLERKLLDYDVEGHVTEIHPGPIITMYEFEPAAGVKVGKIVNLEDDLSLIMGGRTVRIVAHLPGKAAVGIEIPNSQRETVWLKDIIGASKFQRADSKLTLALGKDIEGFPFVADLAKMPHLLVAGATGSGKSVSVNSMVLSLLYKGTPEDLKMIMIDLKMLELSMYDGIPHLLLPVLTQPKKAALALRWATEEMERRYEVLAAKGARNIVGYNKMIEKDGQGEKLPLIVIIIDELADLMMTAGVDVERSIMRLAQMARAAGIHLILATQRPSVDVLTGLIKANFPARISFKVSSKHDSRTILDTVGSEHLLGSGDMLFMAPNSSSQLTRIHGAFVGEKEILSIVEHLKKQGTPVYDENILKPREDEAGSGLGEDEDNDALYDQAVSLVTETRQASISMIQRRLKVGYNRAARMVERMERKGVIGPADGAKPREVLARTYEEV